MDADLRRGLWIYGILCAVSMIVGIGAGYFLF